MRFNPINVFAAAVLSFHASDAMAQDKDATSVAPTHRYSFHADAKDSVGHADGTLEGAAAIRDGQVHLNGTRGTYVNLPGGLIAGYHAVTFEFWTTLGTNKNWPRVFDQGSTNGNQGGYDLYFCPRSGAKDFRLTIMDPHPTSGSSPFRAISTTRPTCMWRVFWIRPPVSWGFTPTACSPNREKTSAPFPA